MCIYQLELSSQLIFKLKNLGTLPRDYMPVINVIKTYQSGIFYAQNNYRDSFQLRSILSPHIQMCDEEMEDSNWNTEVFHRLAVDVFCRVSKNLVFKPKIFDNLREEPFQYWMGYENPTRRGNCDRPDELRLSVRIHHHRSSLMLLEPLLMLPDVPTARERQEKHRIAHNEHVKIVRIVIAYTLSFFLLIIVTFYIVYFA